jgi:Domain of Unknown Function (DUF1080)
MFDSQPKQTVVHDAARTIRLVASWRGIASGVLALAALAATGCANTSPSTQTGGTQTLIDGASGLTNWTTLGTANWRASADAIEADQPNDGSSGYLVSKQIYANFRLHAEFWISEDGKSGVFFRCADPMQINSKTCYETQIYPHRVDQYGTGALVNVAPVDRRYMVAGQWNSIDIDAVGEHLTVVLNGARTVDIDHAGLRDGNIVLQFRGGVVRYRQLTVEPK